MELQKCNSDKSRGNLFFQEYFKKSKVKLLSYYDRTKKSIKIVTSVELEPGTVWNVSLNID